MKTKQATTTQKGIQTNTLKGPYPLKRVAIVGGGVAGLCTAITLVRQNVVPPSGIEIFEARTLASDSGKGAGLNLNSGNAILSREYGIKLRHTTEAQVAFKAKSQLLPQTSTKAAQTLFDINFVRSFSRKQSTKYLLESSRSSFVVTMLREDLHHILRNCVENQLGVRIHRGSKYALHHIDKDETLVFQNGLRISGYDLIVGADGVHSKAREYVIPTSIRHKKPSYTGVKVRWAISNRSKAIDVGEMRQYVGQGGVAVCYAVRNDLDMIAFLYRDKRPGSENVGYRTKDRTDCYEAKGMVVQQMKKCGIPDRIVNAFQNGHRFIQSSVYEHQPLQHWSRGRVVLVGDAAHAMAPFLGQGANQTIQDAHVLALSLSRLGTKYSSLEQALRKYEHTFQASVKDIMMKSRFLGYILTQNGFSGNVLRKMVGKLSRLTGLLEHDIVSSFQPRFCGQT